MKEILDKESKKALVAYRIQRAYETLREAEVMIRESFYNAAINRLYYACYYATVALLLKYDIQTQTHNGVKTMLGLHFISTGKLPVKVGKTFSTLFNFSPSLSVFLPAATLLIRENIVLNASPYCTCRTSCY